MTWNGRKVEIGGIGGVSTRDDCRRRGYASLALNAAIRTMRDHEALQFALLFCEPHNFAFYQSRGWHPFTGEIFCRTAGADASDSTPWRRLYSISGAAPREGVIDLCGLPW